ncbi:MAG: hypothetical protein LKM38_06015 [Pseudomonas veronii]|nr:hypothetical protein [Pseudomonas veronii]
MANLLAENGHAVRQWMRDPEQAEAIRVHRENPRYLKGIKIHPAVEPVTDLQATLEACELCFVALPSSALRSVLAPHAERLAGKLLVSLTKGIEAHTFKADERNPRRDRPAGAHRRAVRAEPGAGSGRTCADRHP